MHIMQMESIKPSRNLLPTLHPKIELLRRQQISSLLFQSCITFAVVVVFQVSPSSYLWSGGIFSLQPDMRAPLEIPGEGLGIPYSPNILFLVAASHIEA